MLPWLIIAAERPRTGRGVLGYALAWFLRTYFGRRAVRVVTPEAVGRGALPRAEVVFLGLPTPLAPDDIRRIADRAQPRRLVPFDYLDQHELAWTPEQEPALRELCDRYFKPWFESAWNWNLCMGLLPLRNNRRSAAAVALHRAALRLGRRPRPASDVAFLGRPNRTQFFIDGAVRDVDQRVHWLLEIKRQAPDLQFAGGLVDCEKPEFYEQQALYGDLTDLRYKSQRANYHDYWQTIRRSRVVLAPGGNVPWTYRHYEALYSGAAVVTVDYRQRDLLIPMPRDNVVHVPDGGPVLPAVRAALELAERHPTLGEENYAHMERYLRLGAYSRRRPALLERFLTQLD